MGRQIENTANNKILIAEAFLKLLETQPVDSISIKRIIEKCGVSRQTFYYHYDDIFSVIEFLFSGMIERAKTECIKKDNSLETVRTILKMIDDNRFFIKKLVQSKMINDFQLFASIKIADLFNEVWVNHTEKSRNLSHEDASFIFQFLSYGLMGYTIRPIMADKPLDIDSIAEKMHRMALGQLKLIG